MKRTSQSLLATLLLLLAWEPAEAKIGLSPLFSNHLVLQQQSEVVIWGESDQKQVEAIASWGAKGSTKVDSSGQWMLRITTPAGSYEHHTLTLQDGDQTLRIEDLLIGEVWVCSGQSNMYMTLCGYKGQPVEGAFETVMQSTSEADRIRMVTLPKRASEEPQRNFEGEGWQVPSPTTTWEMSASAYYFAQSLTEVLRVPVGIISTSWGGSAIEAWMSSDDLREMGYKVEQLNADPKREERRKCSLLYNGLIAPVEGYTARGFLWYQGESNRHTADCYAEQMEQMVRFWRERWAAYSPNEASRVMPFYYVQIAPYAYKDAAADDGVRLMQAQTDALDRIPRSGMVSTLDLGEEMCIHPARKQPVGLRLAALALQDAYGWKLPNEATRPARFKEAKLEQGRIIVTFSNARYGLTPQHQSILGFEVAGSDGIFHPAEAQIILSQPQVELTCPAVPEPKAVRYAWRNFTPTNLHNSLGQPVLPFRVEL